MKLKKEYIVHSAGGESFLVPTGGADFSGIVKGNETFGAVLDLLKEETTEAELITSMKSRFDAPEGAIERDVQKVINELRKIGALDG